MKTTRNILETFEGPMALGISLLLSLLISLQAIGQDEEATKPTGKDLARPAFESALLGEMQSVITPTAKTLEFDFQHRFGTVENGLTDLFGIYSPGANIRMGLTYTPINRLAVGIGLTKNKMTLDLNAKYAIFQQAKQGGIPVSVTYFGSVAAETQKGEYSNNVQRLAFYNEAIIARRINSKLSIQLSPSYTHDNAVVDSAYNNNMIAVGIGARYKFTAQSSLILNYIQPLTKHKDTALDPKPGFMIGWEISTSAHAFQILFSNYQGILPQQNIPYNPLDFFKGQYLIGFNITRLWNF